MRSTHEYEYVAVLDTDEVILPTRDTNWPDMLERLQKWKYLRAGSAGVMFQHAYYLYPPKREHAPELKDIPRYTEKE